LQGQVENIQAGLTDLQGTHQTLVEDIAGKDRALSVDRTCASHRSTGRGYMSYGFSKVGKGQRFFSDTATSMLRQVPT